MTSFWFGAAVLAAVAMSFLAIPLWRESKRSGNWSVSGFVATLAVIPIAFGLYLRVNTYSQDADTGPSNEDRAIVQQLADRLVANPDDVNGWRLLARSYMTLGEYGRARDAYLEAWDRTPEPDNDLKLGLGEALIYTDPASVSAQAGDLIEDVVTAEPANQRALWWGGVVALERGHEELARTRWTTLLGFNPPREVADIIRRQLAVLPPGGEPGASAPAAAAPASGPSIELDVSLGADMTLDGLGPNSYLFVFARAPGGGPPIAGARYPVSALPGSFTLSDANAIIAGRSLSAFPTVTVVARISVNGDPIEQPGDLYAEAEVEPGAGDPVTLVIDRVVE